MIHKDVSAAKHRPPAPGCRPLFFNSLGPCPGPVRVPGGNARGDASIPETVGM